MKKNKKWIIAFLVVIAIAILLQTVTYKQYSKLQHAVNVFNTSMENAKTTKDAENAYLKFRVDTRTLISLSESHAAKVPNFGGAVLDGLKGLGNKIKGLAGGKKGGLDTNCLNFCGQYGGGADCFTACQ